MSLNVKSVGARATDLDASVLSLCEIAGRLEEDADHRKARNVLLPYWPDFNEPPILSGLQPQTQAYLLLRVGVASSWIGSERRISGVQDKAKSLLSKSKDLFTACGDPIRAAESQIELALCYWREGAYDEARILIKGVLETLPPEAAELRLLASVRAAGVESSAGQPEVALQILAGCKAEFESSPFYAVLGKYHNVKASALTVLGSKTQDGDLLAQALQDYETACALFIQAGLKTFHAIVENNLAFLCYEVGEYPAAREHLARSRATLRAQGDFVRVAQLQETFARVLLGEYRNDEAEREARESVAILQSGDERSLLAESLVTHGIALARLGRVDEARSQIEAAIALADLMSDPAQAGRARNALKAEIEDERAQVVCFPKHDRAVHKIRMPDDSLILRGYVEGQRVTFIEADTFRDGDLAVVDCPDGRLIAFISSLSDDEVQLEWAHPLLPPRPYARSQVKLIAVALK